ncbi:MAG: hypothetical protein WCF06_09720 [Nitrososphaeraceae archaeon]
MKCYDTGFPPACFSGFLGFFQSEGSFTVATTSMAILRNNCSSSFEAPLINNRFA